MRQWWRHGFWNTLEHGLTRFSDSIVTLVLLWVLSPEVFSILALAQAIVAPCLFFFLTPETVIYRDYNRWKEKGEMMARVRALRWFGWMKGALALVLSLIIAQFSGFADSFQIRFFALLWAFGLVLGPQVLGADREFLRLNLNLKALNLLTFFQKTAVLGVTIGVGFWGEGSIILLSAFICLVLLFLAVFTRFLSEARFSSFSNQPNRLNPAEMILDAIRSFTFWQHLNGVVLNWIRTMDLFFAGIFGLPAREVGLYAASVKLAGFSHALPQAVGNLFSIWIGRNSENRKREKSLIQKYSLILFFLCVVQAGLLYLLSPWFLEFLSRGRWSDFEQLQMRSWLGWLLLGMVLMSSTVILTSILTLRTRVRNFTFWTYLPWGALSVVLYGVLVAHLDWEWIASLKIWVGVSFLAFLFIYLRRFYWEKST